METLLLKSVYVLSFFIFLINEKDLSISDIEKNKTKFVS